MDLFRSLSTVVITYEDGECVRLSGEEAEKFRAVMRRMHSVYNTTVLSADGNELLDLNSYFKYELIREKSVFGE